MPDYTIKSTGVMVICVTSRNAMAATGMSWKRCKALARKHGIPLSHVSARTTYISGTALLAAIERECSETPPVRDALDELLIAHGVRPR